MELQNSNEDCTGFPPIRLHYSPMNIFKEVFIFANSHLRYSVSLCSQNILNFRQSRLPTISVRGILGNGGAILQGATFRCEYICSRKYPATKSTYKQKVNFTKLISRLIFVPELLMDSEDKKIETDGVSENVEGEERTLVDDNMMSSYKSENSFMDPPPSVRGMEVLNKSAFDKTIHTYGIYVPLHVYSRVLKSIKSKSFAMKKRRCTENPNECLEDNGQKLKLLLFDPDKVCGIDDLKEDNVFVENGVDLTRLERFRIELTYDSWRWTDIIRAILPPEIPSVSSYTMVGKLAHINLRPEHEKYKFIIGEVVLDKVKYLETVVNKTDNINNVYRNFELELLAGEKNYIQTVNTNGFSYKFDFSKVYWNTRLGTEHDRIKTLLKSGDILYDVFAGVGPFAIPAAKKKVIVFANDLNPASYQSLLDNIPLNKIKTEVHCSNLDGREFIRTVLKKDLYSRWTEGMSEASERKIFITMNLPAIAIEFLDAFVGLMSDLPHLGDIPEHLLPYVNCYCFSKSEDPLGDIQQRAEVVLGEPLPRHHNINMVRNVAPNKDMWRVMFPLPTSVLLRPMAEEITDVTGPEEKRRKLETE